jgi:hypothetical protein
MKSTSSDVKKFWPARLVPVVLALVGAGLAGLAGLAVSGPDGWAIMPADTYAQLLAGLGGMGCFVVLRRKRD